MRISDWSSDVCSSDLLFEQRHVDIGFDVALGAGIAVPVPGAAEIAGLFDDANVGDADLVQFRRREKATETAPEHERIDRLVDRVAAKRAIDIQIVDVAAKVDGPLDLLPVSLGVQPTGAFLGIF